METIAFQKRSEELAEKQPELHQDTYEKLVEFTNGKEGFTLCNIVNEALAQFLGIGDLARMQELVESRLEDEGVPLPPASQRDLQEKINLVAEDEKTWTQVFDVHSRNEWQDTKGEIEDISLNIDSYNEDDHKNTTIYLNTNYRIWDEVSNAPSYRSYIVNIAIEVWFNTPFNGSCDHLLSLQQLLAASNGEDVSYDEATEWAQRRMDGLRPQSDGDHHEEWEALFSSDDSPAFDISEVTMLDEVEINEKRAKKAWMRTELTQNGQNPAGVLRAVLRGKDENVWDREGVEEIANNIFDGASPQSKEGYVNSVISEVNTGIEIPLDEVEHPVDESGKKVEEVPEMRQYFSDIDHICGYVPAVLRKAFEGARYTISFKDGEGSYGKVAGRNCDEFAAGLIQAIPDEVWESEEFVGSVEDAIADTYPEKQAQEALDAHSPIKL